MIEGLRKNLKSWGVRLLFVLLALAFGLWGIADIVRNMGASDQNWVAKVGDVTVTPEALDTEFRRNLAQALRQTNAREASPEIKRAVIQQSIQRLIAQAALSQEATRLGVVVPDEVLRQAIFDLPVFKGPSGAFDRATFDNVLRQNNLTEPRLLTLVKADLAQRQVLEPVRAGAAMPAVLVREAYRGQHERRAADLVLFPFGDPLKVPEPDEATVRRWFDLHPDLYATPELRRVKAVVLTVESVARDVAVSEDEVKAAYEAHRDEFNRPETRTARVATLPDQTRARALVDAWRGGADWARIQAMAAEAGGSAVELTDASRVEFPSPALADAVFSAEIGRSADPVTSDGRWNVVLVTATTPGKSESLEQARVTVRARLAAERAGDLMSERANKVEDVFAGGGSLGDLPGDLGLVAVQGTLDSRGNTAEGAPAPIPGPPELKAALVEAAFAAAINAPPHFQEVPTQSAGGGQAYYAVTVEAVTPPAPTEFEAARAKAEGDWAAAESKREAEVPAAALLGALQSGTAIGPAALAANVAIRRTPLFGPGERVDGVPPALVAPLFALKKDAATMVETPEGFVVATAAEIDIPNPDSDPAGMSVLREQLSRGAADDMELTLVNAVRDRMRPQINPRVAEQVLSR